jgi:hypothetical protein
MEAIIPIPLAEVDLSGPQDPIVVSRVCGTRGGRDDPSWSRSSQP